MFRNVGLERIVKFIVSSGRGIFLCTKWRQCHMFAKTVMLKICMKHTTKKFMAC